MIMKISKRSARQHCSANVKHGAGWRPWRTWSFLFILPSVLRAEACQAKVGFHWRIVKVIIRSVNKDLVKTQYCDFAHDSVIYDQVKTRLSGLQAEVVELNIVIGSSFRLWQSGFYWTVSDGEQSRKTLILSHIWLCLWLWFFIFTS